MSDEDLLLIEDVAIDKAAQALCWNSRPVTLGGIGDMDELRYWQAQGPVQQRIFRQRARIVVEAWEAAHAPA